MGFLEVIGVASILPFMQLMAEPDAIQKSSWLTAAYEFANFSSPREMLIYSGVSIIILIGITNAFNILTIYLQYKFSWDIAHNLSIRLLRNYLNKPYDFYLKTNTSSLQAYITVEVGSLTGGIIVPIIELVSRIFVSAFIFMMLMMVDLKVALVMFGCLGSAYLLIYLSQKNHLKKIGKYRLEMNKLRFKSLKELFDGIKTIKVQNKQDYFYDRYEYASKEFCSIQPTYNLFLAAPKSVLEFLAFGSILGITMYLYISSGNIQSTIPRLSLYAVAGYRLLPALQKIFSSVAKLRYNFPIVNKLHQDLQLSSPLPLTQPSKERLPFQDSLELSMLQFSYENSEEKVIDDLSISIAKGQTIAFIGSTGSGKTTLVDLIVGLLDPSKGAIKLDGIQLTKSNKKSWQQQLAYVPQEVFLFDDSIINNITFGN
ncbi:MAG: ATP-binding cassette domain-containing protein, partial [Saprospiraceae bacterium]